MLFSKILVPVDFSRRCERMANYACALGEHYQSNVLLLNVIETPSYGVPSAGLDLPAFVPVHPDWKLQHEARLKDFAQRLLRSAPVETAVLEGFPADVIIDFANDWKADLIALPTHGYGVFRRLLIGSVTSRVLHDAACPVLTGAHLEQEPAEDHVKFQRVLCALDLKGSYERVLEWAARFACDFRAELALLHAVPAPYVSVDTGLDPGWQAELERMAENELREASERLGIRKAAIRIASGSPITCMAEEAREWGASVAIIGRSADPGLGGRLRANAYGIIRQSPCPVISV